METLHVISHTHWDREWYLTFQQFRLKLVHLIDKLLDILDEDPDFKYFMLDGQTIVLEDYLLIRPEMEHILRGHIQSGRLLIGPWYILPDMFLVSPEAHIAIQKTFFEGGTLGAEAVPKDMMAEAGTSCSDCHLDGAEKVVRPDGGACVACHDENYRKTFTEWRDGVRGRIERVRAALHALYKRPLTEAEKAGVGKIEKALETIGLDGSSGIHNYMFIDDYLTKLEAQIRSLGSGKEGLE